MVAEGLAVTPEPAVELRPVPGDHVYVAAPPAVSDTLLPVQMVAALGVTVTANDGATVIVTFVVLLQPVEVPVTTYVCVLPGAAVTVAPLVALKPVEGDHA